MNILVTGGAGFIGSHIVEALVDDPTIKRVRIMDNLSTGFLDNIKPFIENGKVEFFRADLRFQKKCQKAVKDMDAVCHQAAIGSVPRSIDDPITTHDNNVNGFIHLLEAARNAGIKKVVYASSSSVYGDATDQPKVEGRIGKPLSPYAVSKYANELYAEVFAKCYNMQLVGFRYFNVFGPRQDPFGPYAAVIPLFIKSALERISPIIHGDGSITRDYTYVKNVVKANLHSLSPDLYFADHMVFNIACGVTTTLNELWSMIKELTGSDTEAIHGKNKKGDILQSLADVSAAEKALGYAELVHLKDGLLETIPWYHERMTKEKVTNVG